MNQFTLAEASLAGYIATILCDYAKTGKEAMEIASDAAYLAYNQDPAFNVYGKLLALEIAKLIRREVPKYASQEDLPAAIKAVAGYAAEIACNKLERHDNA